MFFHKFSKLSRHFTSGKTMGNMEEVFHELFQECVRSVQPNKLVREAVRLQGQHLTVSSKTYVLKRPVKCVGFGKAVFGMAIELEKVLGNALQRAVVSVPIGTLNSDLKFLKNSRIEFMEGAHNNLPDEKAMDAALSIKAFVENSNEDDTVIVLISGGGSALLPLPKSSITLREKYDLIRNLSKSGADIFEMNCVRKELSQLKGGKLSELCYPAKVITLILSDVIGDPLDIIASGPTCVNRDSTEYAIEILKKYSLFQNLPKSIIDVLNENKVNKPNFSRTDNVDHYILGNNVIAARAALVKTQEKRFQSVIISTKISGDVGEISKTYAKLALIFAEYKKRMKTNVELIETLLSLKPEIDLFEEETLVKIVNNFDPNRDICLILAGEPTVVVKGSGLGGRNQQLALSFSLELSKLDESAAYSVSFMSCGTDGMDGPTDAAGAIGYSSLVQESREEGLNPEKFLENNDSYNFYSRFQNGRCLVRTGHTGTNVMDIHSIVIKDK